MELCCNTIYNRTFLVIYYMGPQNELLRSTATAIVGFVLFLSVYCALCGTYSQFTKKIENLGNQMLHIVIL